MNRDFNLLKAIALRDKQSHDDEERRARILKRNFYKALDTAENNIAAKRETNQCEMKRIKKS